MDLLVALTLIVVCYIPIAISEFKLGKAIYALVPFIIGLFVAQEGLTYGTTVISTVGTNINLVFVAFLTLGSIISIFGLTAGGKPLVARK